jgi:eukaryotic-like serine/threonine-protein kinase
MELADNAVAPEEGDPDLVRNTPPASTLLSEADAGLSSRPYEPRTLAHDLKRRGCLPPEECLRIGVALTSALAHLHQHGLIHRDIKPSNIIFVHGQPKLADVGLVAEANEARSFVGTEGFIPPEGPGSVQADVYSLGKVLYEISTGKDRHEYPQLPTMLEEPSNARDLIELNEIILKACRADPRQRYGTAREMQADLLLLQRGVSIKHLRKVERRLAVVTRASVVAGMTALLAVVGYVASIKQIHRARRAEQEAAAHAETAKDAAKRSDQVAQFLKDMLEGVGPSVAKGRDATILRDILDRTVERIGRDLKGQPEIQAELFTTVGSVYWRLGEYDIAETMHTSALRLRRAVFGAEHLSVADALSNLGAVLLDHRKLAEAEDIGRKALNLRRKLLGPEDPAVAVSLNNLGNVLYHRGDLPGAATMHREALEIRSRAIGDEHVDTAKSLNNLANCLTDLGDTIEAAGLYERALQIFRREFGAEDAGVATVLYNLGIVSAKNGDLRTAEQQHREVVSMRQKLLGQEHPELANALNQVAGLLAFRGQLDEAESMVRSAIGKKLLDSEHPYVGDSLHLLGIIMGKRARFTMAEDSFRRALAIRRKRLSLDHPDVADSLTKLGIMQAIRGQHEASEVGLIEAMQMYRRLYASRHPDQIAPLWGLHWLAKKRADADADRKWQLEVNAVAGEKGRSGTRALLEAILFASDLLHAQGDFAAAEPLIMEAFEEQEKLQQPQLAEAVRIRGDDLYRAWAALYPPASTRAAAWQDRYKSR